MKKIIISLIIVFAFSNIYAGPNSSTLENSPLVENVTNQDHEVFVYKLYPTQNMWNFIKLNTRNGQMWQVQFDVEGDNQIETFLSLFPLVSKEKEVNGRFALYPTQNMWTFILLDQIDGRTWQVQWSIEPENRGIFQIK